MLALVITVTVLLLIALLRFGVIIEYGEAGFMLWAKIGFLRLRIPDSKKEIKPEKKIKDINLKGMMPGSLYEFMDMLRAVGNSLGRLKRRLLIKQLTLHYTAAGEDPAKTAIQYGVANAVFGTIIPVLERHFRIKHRDLEVFADFNAKEQGIYAKATVSIAVWEVFYAAFALFPIITAIFKSKPAYNSTGTNDRKDGENNGKSPDK